MLTSAVLFLHASKRHGLRMIEAPNHGARLRQRLTFLYNFREEFLTFDNQYAYAVKFSCALPYGKDHRARAHLLDVTRSSF